MASQTHFTVIIPTRDRADTLRECLRTCVVQDYPNVRFIVSNNASRDDTEAVVRSFDDPRVELISTDARIGMSQNFEFAIRHAFATGPEDTFLSMLGDDDGLMRNGLAVWDRNIQEHPGAKAFSWPFSCYYWPDCVESLTGNRINVLIEGHKREIVPADALRRFERFEGSYGDLARVYYGLVHRRLVESVEHNGRLIHSMIPDVYLGAAITARVDRVVMCPYPLILPAISRHSSGGEHVIGGSTRAPSHARAQFRTEPNLPPHPKIGIMPPSVRICELEVMLHLTDLGIHPFAPEPTAFFRAAIAELADRPGEKRAEVLDRLEKIAGLCGWEAEWDREKIPESPATVAGAVPAKLNFSPSVVSGQIDGAAHGLKTIFDATGLFSILLGNGDVAASVFGQYFGQAEKPEGEKGSAETLQVARQALHASKTVRTAVQKAVKALYRSKRWCLSRYLASPKRWRERKTDPKLEAARRLVEDSATAAEEEYRRLKEARESPKQS